MITDRRCRASWTEEGFDVEFMEAIVETETAAGPNQGTFDHKEREQRWFMVGRRARSNCVTFSLDENAVGWRSIIGQVAKRRSCLKRGIVDPGATQPH